MSDNWKLLGQADKAVDDTERTLEALRVQGLRVQFQAMAVSSMSWTVWLDDISEVSTYVPELRQTMTLFLNDNRFFHGWVVGRDPLKNSSRLGYRVTVVDAWFFLSKTMLSSDVLDGAGNSKERPVYLLPTGDITDHVQSVVSRAIALGMPVQPGSMADGFDVPRLSLQNQSIGAALSDLMGWLADGVLYLDHSGSGHVAINLTRRESATTITLEHGAAVITEINMKPRVDLQVEEVKLAAARRATVGNQRVTVWDQFVAGTATSPLPTRGIVAITGPEINLTLPEDITDSVYVEIGSLTPTNAIQQKHDIIKQGGTPRPEVYDSQVNDVYAPTGGGLSGGGIAITTSWPDDPLSIITDSETGEEIDPRDWGAFLIKGEPRDWWKKDGIEYKQLRVTATVASFSDESSADPKWARLLRAKKSSHFIEDGTTRTVWQATVSVGVTAVRGLTNGTIIRSEDWGWFNPPADLAENLLASQSFVPWEGTVTTVQEELAHGNPVGSKLNISSWVPETATMGALITGCTIIPRTGEVIYQCGPPLRHSFLDLVNRFRQSGADNYYWLASPDDDGSASGGAPGTGGGGGTPANAELTEDGQVTLTESGQTTLTEQ